jgi:uncharacterized membrane protein YhaH (DUF805 family)
MDTKDYQELITRYSKQSDDQLSEIIRDAANYREEAVAAAKDVMSQRSSDPSLTHRPPVINAATVSPAARRPNPLLPVGRISRGTLWSAWIGLTILFFLLQIAISPKYSPVIFYIGFFALIYLLVVTKVKRLHDLNKSGWWLAALMLPGIALEGVPPLIDMDHGATREILEGVGSLVTKASSLAIFIWLGFIAGTAGANRFGEPPR